MARRARRTPLEKYQEELFEVQASIEQYELLEVQNMSLDDLKELLTAEGGSVQIA